MAIIKNGINGPISGKVGTVIGGTWKGIPYIRVRPKKTKKRTSSPKQLAQQQKFAVVARFANSLTPLLDMTFRNLAVNKTGRNSAISYLLKRALTEASPLFELDYPQVMISRGDLVGAAGATSTLGADRTIHFNWADNTGTKNARATDKAIIAVFCPDLQESKYAITEATRSSGTVSLPVHSFRGHTVHTWLGFIDKKGKEVADSVYTGALVVG